MRREEWRERTGVSRTQGDRHLTKCQLDRAQRSGRCSEEWQVPACSDLMRQATNRWQNWMYIYRRVRTTVLGRPYLAGFTSTLTRGHAASWRENETWSADLVRQCWGQVEPALNS